MDVMTPETEPAERPRSRRWFQFRLRMLLVFTLVVAVVCSWFATEIRKIERRRQTIEKWSEEFQLKTWGSVKSSWYRHWLCRVLGYEDDYDPTFLVFNPVSATVDDDMLAAVAEFGNLEGVGLDGEIRITDAGLEHLKGLKQLRELGLGDAHVSPEAVARLRRALPDCEITWVPPRDEKKE